MSCKEGGGVILCHTFYKLLILIAAVDERGAAQSQ